MGLIPAGMFKTESKWSFDICECDGLVALSLREKMSFAGFFKEAFSSFNSSVFSVSSCWRTSPRIGPTTEANAAKTILSISALILATASVKIPKSGAVSWSHLTRSSRTRKKGSIASHMPLGFLFTSAQVAPWSDLEAGEDFNDSTFWLRSPGN